MQVRGDRGPRWLQKVGVAELGQDGTAGADCREAEAGRRGSRPPDWPTCCHLEQTQLNFLTKGENFLAPLNVLGERETLAMGGSGLPLVAGGSREGRLALQDGRNRMPHAWGPRSPQTARRAQRFSPGGGGCWQPTALPHCPQHIIDIPERRGRELISC